MCVCVCEHVHDKSVPSLTRYGKLTAIWGLLFWRVCVYV